MPDDTGNQYDALRASEKRNFKTSKRETKAVLPLANASGYQKNHSLTGPECDFDSTTKEDDRWFSRGVNVCAEESGRWGTGPT